MLRRQPLKLHDCAEHGLGSGAELYIVEGDSAAGSVERMRHARFQAVLPMQGKPLNTVRATRAKVLGNPWFAALIDAIGAGVDTDFNLQAMRYDRVILLMDADADGIHCGALATMFFHRWMRPLLEGGRLGMALAPVATVRVGEREHYPLSATDLSGLLAQLAGQADVSTRRYRGLAGTDLEVLAATCLRPETRTLRRLGVRDAQAAIEVFGGA